MKDLVALVFAVVLALSLRGATVELKTGERLDGNFRQASSTGVVIEAAGQEITIPLDRVQAIYFGEAKARPVSGPAPSQDALDALRAIRSVVEAGASYQDYASRVLDAKIKADKYQSASGNDAADLRSAIGLAMREYELASRAWDGSFRGHEDLAMWQKIEANLDTDILKKCPVVSKVVKSVELGAAYQTLGRRDTATVDGQTPWAALWTCATAQVAEAERLLAK
jgi:hypothetical protein